MYIYCIVSEIECKRNDWINATPLQYDKITNGNSKNSVFSISRWFQ